MRLALLGHDIDHSWSPEMQAAALEAAGYGDATYEIVDLSSDELDRSWSEIATEFDGINVTVPHKEAVLRFVDEIDDGARATGAVNTIGFFEHGVLGTNTDVIGFRRMLECAGGVTGGRVVVLGAGGAARAVARVFDAVTGSELEFCARTRERAESVAGTASVPTSVSDWADRDAAIERAEIVVNTTPLGRDSAPWPVAPERFAATQRVFDLNYGVGGSAWANALRRSGCRLATSGETMLLEQGIAAFEFWTGRRADRKAMREAIAALYLEALGE